MNAGPAEWLHQLGNSGLSAAMQDSVWLYPAMETVHLLGLAALVGCAVAFDLRLLGVSRHLPAKATARHLLTCARVGFGVAAISGFLLFASDPVAIWGNPAFRWKLVLIGVAGLNALRFHIGPFRTADEWQGDVAPLPARIAAVVSLGSWAGAVTAGRLIAYV
jgi:hypothetical protein